MKYTLLLCCHNRFDIVPEGFTPIQCGSALNPPVSEAEKDDVGDNISQKNPSYCELTAHYFAWKNIDAEYYGFCHYRRFFVFNDRIKKPYIVCGTVSENDITLLGNRQKLEQIFQNHDMIVTRSENMGLTVSRHYCTSKYHYREDLEQFIRILEVQFPDYKIAAERYLSQCSQHFCNMFVMKKADFHEYCSVLFSVLAEFDKVKRVHGDFQSDRTDGYLGEIFTGIFIARKREQGLRIKELPRMDVGCTAKKRVLYYLLPPESRARFIVKRWIKKLKRKHETKT